MDEVYREFQKVEARGRKLEDTTLARSLYEMLGMLVIQARRQLFCELRIGKKKMKGLAGKGDLLPLHVGKDIK